MLENMTIRKFYKEQSKRTYLIVLMCFFVCMLAFMFLNVNNAVHYAIGILGIITGLVGIIGFIDYIYLNTATKSFDEYIKALSKEDINRIEDETRDFDPGKRVLFLEKEIIFLSYSKLYVYPYKDIHCIQIDNSCSLHLYNNDSKKIGLVPLGRLTSKSGITNKLYRLIPGVTIDFIEPEK